MKNVPRQFLDKLQGKLQSNVTEGDLRVLAGQMKAEDFADETKLRQVIKALAAMSGTAINEEKEEKIIQMFRENQINPADLSSLTKLLK